MAPSSKAAKPEGKAPKADKGEKEKKPKSDKVR